MVNCVSNYLFKCYQITFIYFDYADVLVILFFRCRSWWIAFTLTCVRLLHAWKTKNHACHVIPCSPNLAMLSDLFELCHFISPTKKYDQLVIMHIKSNHNFWLQLLFSATVCMHYNQRQLFVAIFSGIGQMKWLHSNNLESLARFGEHGLTWLQSVDGGPAFTDDYSQSAERSNIPLRRKWWMKLKHVTSPR